MNTPSKPTPSAEGAPETAPDAAFEGWRFGDCELRPQLRELKVNGRVQPLPPKTLDLLLLLIRERHRVLSHEELVQHLWGNAASSTRLLPAAISKVRAAIDTDGRQWGHETSAIRTVHRMGYRFVAPLQTIEAAPPAQTSPEPLVVPLPEAAPANKLRLGLLRCINRTGSAALDWVEVGLMALVGHALARDRRLQVVDTETLVKWPADAQPEDGTALEPLMESLGLRSLVRCTLKRQGEQYRLEHELLSHGRSPVQGSMDDANPLALGLQFAQAVQSMLFGEQAAPMHLESEDEFVNLVFARAVALFAQRDYVGSADLMTVVCNMQPSSLAAELWRLRAWSHAGDERAASAAVAFLARARASGDEQTLALAHAALGNLTYL